MKRAELFNKNYKEILFCQLTGCNTPILKKTRNKRNKYCCDQHAEKAKKQYRRLWVRLNKDKISKHNKTYQLKLKKNENK